MNRKSFINVFVIVLFMCCCFTASVAGENTARDWSGYLLVDWSGWFEKENLGVDPSHESYNKDGGFGYTTTFYEYTIEIEYLNKDGERISCETVPSCPELSDGKRVKTCFCMDGIMCYSSIWKNPRYFVCFDKVNTSQVNVTLFSSSMYSKRKWYQAPEWRTARHTHQYNATQLIDGTLTLGKAVTDAGGKVFWETDAGIQEWVSG